LQSLFSRQDLFHESGVASRAVVGRLKPGYSLAPARADLSVIARHQDRPHPGRKTTLYVTNGSASEGPDTPGLGWAVVLWMATATLVLLIACTNMMTLLVRSRNSICLNSMVVAG
jgi:hypothetical protein